MWHSFSLWKGRNQMIVKASNRSTPLTLEEIAELLSEYSMTDIVRGIVAEGKFSFDAVGGVLYTRKEGNELTSCVQLGIRDMYTEAYPQYYFTLDEFIDMMKMVRDGRIEVIKTGEAWKDRRDEAGTVEALYEELADFFLRYKEEVKKHREQACDEGDGPH